MITNQYCPKCHAPLNNGSCMVCESTEPIITGEAIHFRSKLGKGACELTFMPEGALQGLPIKPGYKWLWFSRLYVWPGDRKKGVAKDFLKQLCEYADRERFAIIDGLNPYPGQTDMEGLIRLMELFDFEIIQQDDAGTTMIRYPKE